MISVSASAAAVPEPIEAKSSDGVNAPRFGHTFVVYVGYGGVRGLVFLLNTVTVAPVLLFRLGADQFAIFAQVMPFLRFGFNGIFDMGLATAVVRHVSTAAASDDKQGNNRYVATAACLYVFFGVALLLLYHFLAPQLIPLLVWHNAGAAATVQIVFRASLVIYIGFLFCNPFFALLMGIRQLHSASAGPG